MHNSTITKIIIVSSDHFFSSYGGGQVYVKNLVNELVRKSILPVIITPCSSSATIESYKGCAIYTFDTSLGKEEFKTLNSLLTEINPDLVHVHGFKAPFVLVCKELNIPCVITAHHGGILCPAGSLLNHRDEICSIKSNQKDCLPCVLKNIRGGMVAWPLLKILPLSFRLYLGKLIQKLPFIFYVTPILQASQNIQNKAEEWKTIYTNASLLIAPSKAIADSMKLNGAPANKVKVAPHGIPLPEPAMLTEYNDPKREDSQPLKFFFVGRICHVKGVHVMFTAFNKFSTNAELHIIGGAYNKTEERYMCKVKKLSLHNPRIIWHGKVEPQEVNRLIIQYDIMIHPTICLEVFGLNIAEALALGKPVIATRCGGAEMQVIDGVNGWLVEPNNADALSDVIQKLINHPKVLQTVTKNGPFYVKSIEDHIYKLIDLYEEIND